MPAPKLIKMSDVPEWLERNYGIRKVTRQTIYNWRTVGKKGVKLRTVSKLGQLHVSERWLHEFASNLA